MSAMRSVETSEVPEQVVGQTRQAMTRTVRRRVWRRRVLQGAAAAVVVVVLLGVVGVITNTSSSLVLADVVQNVAETRTLRAVVVGPHGNVSLFIAGTRTRVEEQNSITIADTASDQQVRLDTRSKLAYRIPQEMGGTPEFYAMFREMATDASTPIDEYVDEDGQRFPGCSGKSTLKSGGDTVWKVDVKVWIDPKTKLPVRVEMQPPEGVEAKAVLFEQIEFDMPLDDALFDMTIPADYTVVSLPPNDFKPSPSDEKPAATKGLPSDQLKPPLSKEKAAELTITPGIGIGEVKFGMSRDEIIEILGEPEVETTDQLGAYLVYPSMGLQMVMGQFVGLEPDEVGMIVTTTSRDAPFLAGHDFPGQTDKGIRIGSTPQEVIDAYGKPVNPFEVDPKVPASAITEGHEELKIMTVARYEKLGMNFTFVNGKLARIVVLRTE